MYLDGRRVGEFGRRHANEAQGRARFNCDGRACWRGRRSADEQQATCGRAAVGRVRGAREPRRHRTNGARVAVLTTDLARRVAVGGQDVALGAASRESQGDLCRGGRCGVREGDR